MAAELLGEFRMLSFNSLPNTARIWIVPLETDLGPDGQQILRRELDRILTSWKAHGIPLQGGAEILSDRFIIIAADENEVAASGCSIDSMFRQVRDSAEAAGASLASLDTVFFRDGSDIVGLNRSDFGKLVASGAISPETKVFDNSITYLEQLKSGMWELPFSKSWHSRAF